MSIWKGSGHGDETVTIGRKAEGTKTNEAAEGKGAGAKSRKNLQGKIFGKERDTIP